MVIKAIILDWHGVLDTRTLSSMFKMLLQSSAKSPSSRKVMRRKILTVFRPRLMSKFWKATSEYTAGRLSPHDFWKQMESEFGIEMVLKAQNYLLSTDRNELLWKQLPLLKEKYKLVILSDCPEDKTSFIKKTQDLSIFDATFFSSDYQLLKKNREFFQLVTKRLALKPSECLVIDDSRKNLLLARRRGFKTKFFNPKKTFGLAKLTQKEL